MSTLKGGKTSPRLLQDLRLYNPDRLPTNSYNVLAELAFPYDDKTIQPRTVAKGSCRHQWALKPNACSQQLVDSSEPGLAFAAALCTGCRTHVSLEIDSRGEGNGVKPCPTVESPLHHFRYIPKRSHEFQRTSKGLDSWEDMRLFQCSAQACSARLAVRTKSPRLNKRFTDMLLDQKLIADRVQGVMASDPERFEGHAVPSPLTILTHLRSYIDTAMKGEFKHIQKSNKKFMLSFGDQCAELLSYLGFAQDDSGWNPPRPDVADNAPFTTDLKLLLDDVESELQVLMYNQPEEEKRHLKAFVSFQPADGDLQKLLGCEKYNQSVASRTDAQPDDDEHPFYAGLGAVLDFHDSLIEFAYNRQCVCDPNNLSYYLECIQGIARGRMSEELNIKVVVEASTGKVSMSDIRDAYGAFGLDMNSLYLDDEHIIGTFRSRISDAPRQEDDLRKALAVIGQHRNSVKIEQFASNTVTNYEQALSWLGATDGMDDSFIVSMYNVKVNENADNMDFARRCLEFIAKQRNSEAMEAYLKTGELTETEMNVGQAYARLDVTDRTIDDDLILSAYNLACQDQPSQEADLKKALTAIAKDRDSAHLKNVVHSGVPSTEHKVSEWPVGLENIGNTCYLNSLLQFYFTVRPLRDLVLNFDDYKVNFEKAAFERKQVGSRRVSKREVERAQQFVSELRKLFQNMISSKHSSITPEIELARLTLLSSSVEETMRRRSTLKSERPSIGEIQGKQVHGPQPARITEDAARERESTSVVGDGNQAVQSPGTLMGEEEMSSECTLVGRSSPMDVDQQEVQEQANALENKENMAPSKSELTRPRTPEGVLKPLASSSPSRINEQKGSSSPKKDTAKAEVILSPSDKTLETIPAPPSRNPPPVPPRTTVADRKEEMKKEVELGAQQDVTEAISNVLFQLQCAINPESIDESGEQIDKIKKLFFGKQKITTTAKDGKARTKEEFFSDIKIQVSSGPCDIYEALDAAFDLQQVEVGDSKEPQYTSISVLPPILQLHVSRAQFDKEKGQFKANHHLGFKKTIFMDRYMDTDSPELQRRRTESWAWKKELSSLHKRMNYLSTTEVGISMPEALDATVTYLNKLLEDKENPEAIEVDPNLPNLIADSAEKTRYEMKELEARIKTTTANISSQFTDLRSLPYNLHSVIMHRGMVTSGHYWIYIFDFARGTWRKYNDGYVTEVKDTKEIFETEDSARPATSSFLVYVREGMEKELTDAVCRDVDESVAAATSEQQVDGTHDVTMINGGQHDSPMEKLSRWPSDLGGDYGDGMNANPRDGPGTKGLLRSPRIPGHKGVTW